MNNIFNRKLYLEGLKKIRLVGLASWIVVFVGVMIPPVSAMIDSYNYTGAAATVLSINDFAPALLMIFFLTPFFFISMFSYLNKRNESDFYHSLPIKRSCVFLTFGAAIYTWIFAIIASSLIFAGILWSIIPSVTFSVSIVFKLLLIYFFAAFYIGSFMILGMSLTGTTVSNIAVTGLLLLIVRIAMMMLTLELDIIVPALDPAYTVLKLFSLRNWFPTAIIIFSFDASVLSSTALWLYSIAVSVAVYAAADFFYCKRKSECSGNSATGKLAQHVYRCAFTLPFAFMIPIIVSSSGSLSDIALTVAVMLAVYFVYELITTKSIKSTAKAAVYLFVPFLCSGIFALTAFAVKLNVNNQSYTQDDIAAIRVYNRTQMFELYDYSDRCSVFEEYAVRNVCVTDRDAAKIVADAWFGRDDYDWRYHTVNVEITLANGKKIGRAVKMSEKQHDALTEALKKAEASPEYVEAYVRIPDYNDVVLITEPRATSEEQKELYAAFIEEYNALTTEQKVALKDGYDTNSYNNFTIFGYASVDGLRLTFEYYVPETFVKTRECLDRIHKRLFYTIFEYLEVAANGDVESLRQVIDIYCNIEYNTAELSETKNFCVPSNDNGISLQEVELLSERLNLYPSTDRYCYICVYVTKSDYSYEYYSMRFGVEPEKNGN